ncbi:MAG: transglycosylase SLT domain-containing protein, partial [Bacteroidota bacterium]|nr:transglycosylase SLT domain-containing protein [Bacteroidota bacterium]
MKNNIYLCLLILFLPFVVFSQVERTEEYLNYERNYNELLKSYYITSNEKLLNEKFPSSENAYSSNSKASLIADEVYEQRLKSIPSAVNLVYNQQVRNHIIYYLDRMNRSVGVMLGLSKYYFPIFENILDSYGVPTDLKYLVVIESAFNPKAVSKAGATGLWQFMYATGRVYDLRENSIVDDRCDPIKSTIAAARFLSDLYNIYNDWSLVLAAYNCGPGNVNKAMKRSGKRDFWDIYTFLPRETRNYVPAFIAATYVMNFYDKHGIEPVALTQPLSLINDTIKVSKDVYFGQISDVLQIPLEQLKSLNPQYRMDYIPGTQAEYILKLPFDY